jgi:hypothetical protein
MKIYNVRIDKVVEIFHGEGCYRFYFAENSSRRIECIKFGDKYYDIITGLPYKFIKDDQGYIKNPKDIKEDVTYALEVKEKEYEDPTFEDIKSLVRATHLLSKLKKNKQ